MTHPLIGRQVGSYQVTAWLGAGGMGEVYRARDTRLDRIVALKILGSEVAVDEDRSRRFLREARAASALNHPNVAHIYEIGEADGLSFIGMEYVEGQTLEAQIGSRQLDPAQIVAIGTQIADALEEAHGKGITHRDLKPANIMVTPRGQVKVLDFGIAKIARAAGHDESVGTMTLTGPGMVIGTAPYMSPEQAIGADVDHRSDLFSLGVLLYELATGRRPFAGMNPSATLGQLLSVKPEAMSQLNRDVPGELERIVGKCLEKDRDLRYGSAGELLVDLKNLGRDLEAAVPVRAAEPPAPARKRLPSRRWLAGAALVTLAVLGYVLVLRPNPAALAPEITSLAVLPLANLSGDPAQEYFADGMTEALISNLTQIRALDRVISRTSVMRYKGTRKSLPEIARELNVDAVIEGTVQKSGGRVLVTAKLISALTDSPVWARDYERDASDVLKLQSEVARAVAAEIRVQLTPEEGARLAAARDIEPKAHEAYLLGIYHLRTNEDDLRQAIDHFGRAIQLEPGYAAGYAGLARAWSMRGIWGAKNRKESAPFVRTAALKALALDSLLPEAHIELGIDKMYDFDWPGAVRDLTRALELDPNSAKAHQAYADLLMALERHDDAIREMQRAEELDPMSSYIQSRYGRVLYRARQFKAAVPHLERAIALDPAPGNAMPYWILGELYTELHRYEEALANLSKAQSHGASALAISATVAAVYARMGKQNEARRILTALQATTAPAGFSTASVAYAYTALGEKDKAFKVLFRLIEEQNNLATHLKADPPLVLLHSDPRWKQLLRRMNLEAAASGT